jgi:hypothetical protein
MSDAHMEEWKIVENSSDLVIACGEQPQERAIGLVWGKSESSRKDAALIAAAPRTARLLAEFVELTKSIHASLKRSVHNVEFKTKNECIYCQMMEKIETKLAEIEGAK